MASRKSEKQRLKQERIAIETERAKRRQKNLIAAGVGLLVAVAGVALVVLVTSSGGGESSGQDSETFAHVHGLGVNPVDSSLMIATHDGLFRSTDDEATASRVGESRQDLMGFGVSGPNTFVASGHPAPGQDGPPSLGFIRSTDAGVTWSNVSLLGEADLHLLRGAGSTAYALNGATGELIVSDDSGETWEPRVLPDGIVDIAVNPKNPDQALAITSAGAEFTDDAAKSWEKSGDVPPGLAGWSSDGAIYVVAGDGIVSASKDKGSRWSEVGDVGGAPTAIAVDGANLYVALDDNTVLESTDGGESWTERLAS